MSADAELGAVAESVQEFSAFGGSDFAIVEHF